MYIHSVVAANVIFVGNIIAIDAVFSFATGDITGSGIHVTGGGTIGGTACVSGTLHMHCKGCW